MGQTIKYHCDVCRKEMAKKEPMKIQVIFNTDQTEGRPCSPYLDEYRLEICDDCLKKVHKGHYIFASGAMGHNDYYFKKED